MLRSTLSGQGPFPNHTFSLNRWHELGVCVQADLESVAQISNRALS